MKESWDLPATRLNQYNFVQPQRGREFILRVTTGADAFLAVQQFAWDQKIRFAKLHAAFMGGFQPCRFAVWSPDNRNPANWHNESVMTVHNLSMILALGGVIHPRPVKGGTGEEVFPAIHFVIGGGWDVPTVGGHLLEGSIVKGALEFFITEMDNIDIIYPQDWLDGKQPDINYPESWYKVVSK
jgi:predicted DNA-binding protein with PD1-like motif